MLQTRYASPSQESIQFQAPVAQLDRVLPSEGRGRAFESRRTHQFSGFIPLPRKGLISALRV